MRRLLERLNAAVLLAATARERRVRGDSAMVDVTDVPVEPSEPVITPTGLTPGSASTVRGQGGQHTDHSHRYNNTGRVT
ncbi:hypothetical protein E2C01_035180 [Portunus trituberculatus]|uniref:Uncharacterized protein n=1 Tax=Portunus trituberculatus TaxID=210409 RepID=A0A5B7F8M7_PORTR|nr:hypothetical protein [Portunus trituberculatus]